jgi:hypothetical protein
VAVSEVRVSSDALEALYRSVAGVRVSSDVLETLYAAPAGDGQVRVSSDVLEVLYSADVIPAVLVSHDYLEVLYTAEPPELEGCFLARLAQGGVKAGRVLAAGIEGGRIS